MLNLLLLKSYMSHTHAVFTFIRLLSFFPSDAFSFLPFFFSVPPKMNEKDLQTTLVAQEGDNIRIPCIAEGLPPPKYSWKRLDNKPIRSGHWSSECHACI